MIKFQFKEVQFREEGMLKAKVGWKLNFLCQTLGQIVNAKKKRRKLKVLLQWTHKW